MRHSLDKQKTCTLLMLFHFAIFGFSFVVMEKLVHYGCPPILMVGLRFLLGAPVVLLFGLCMPKSGSFSFRPDKKSVLYGCAAGAMLFVSQLFQTIAGKYTSAANNALFTGLNVVFVALITMAITKKVQFKVLGSAAASIVGVALVSGFSFHGFQANVGDGLAVMSGLCFGLNYMLIERLLAKGDVSFSVFTVFQLAVPGALGMVGSLLFERADYAAMQVTASIPWLLYMGVAASALTYLIQTFAQAHLTATTVSVLSCTEPVFATIFSILIGYDAFSLRLAAGFTLIIAATLAVSVNPKKKNA